MIELTDVKTTLEIMELREKYFDDPAALSRHLKLRTDAIKQHAPTMLPNTNIISHSLFMQSAFRFGEYYGHMALFPVLEQQTEKSSEKVQKDQPFGVLSDWLMDYFKGGSAKYEFKVRMFYQSPSWRACISHGAKMRQPAPGASLTTHQKILFEEFSLCK